MAETKYDMVKDSLKIVSGLPYQDTVKMSVQVKTGEESKPGRDSGDYLKGGIRTLSVYVQRNSGRSWRKVPRRVDLNLDYTEKRYSPIRRVTQVRGLREAALAKAEELWDSFKPYPYQIEQMKSGSFNRHIISTPYQHGEGRVVLVTLSGVPYGDLKISSREFRVRVDVDPYVDEVTANSLRPDAQNSIFHNPDESEEDYGSKRSISGGLNPQIVEYITPLLFHAVKKVAWTLAQQRTKYLDKEFKEADELIERLTAGLRNAKQTLIVKNKEVTDFTSRVSAKRNER